MEIRPINGPDEIAHVVALDESVAGSRERAAYPASVAERGCLIVAVERGVVLGFCCLDHSYFFEKPFVSLLIVNSQMRRKGIGQSLLSFICGMGCGEIWTSTNQSNTAMQALLSQKEWQPQGTVFGLDADDPELFFRKTL